uniref:Uncharacterized protein n=1 Tax=Physcomitrium patens TaxID=3218 RepID=A0A2K1L8Y0_PHYPA|nr:hypothetical protein PHYPA_000896 [Physcomitrium patens]
MASKCTIVNTVNVEVDLMYYSYHSYCTQLRSLHQFKPPRWLILATNGQNLLCVLIPVDKVMHQSSRYIALYLLESTGYTWLVSLYPLFIAIPGGLIYKG